MKIREKKLWLRMLSLLLCAAILASFVPVTVRAVEEPEAADTQVSEPAEPVGTTTPAENEDTRILTEHAAGEEIFVGLASDVADSYLPQVTTNSYNVQFHEVPYEAAKAGEVELSDLTSYFTTGSSLHYAFVHTATGKLLLHKAAGDVTSALQIGTGTQVENGAAEAYWNSGKSRFYLSHHFRDQAMWMFKNTAGTSPFVEHSANRFSAAGTVKSYRYAVFAKGTAADGAYWYTDPGDTAATITLQPNHYTGSIAMAAPSSQNIYLDIFEDGSILLYYYNADNPPAARFLGIDDTGNWTIITYETLAEARNAFKNENKLNQVKLRLFRYYETAVKASNAKTVAYKGAQRYTVLTNATMEETVSLIGQNLTVVDTARHNTPIPFSGDAPKVGQYWLELPESYAAGDAGDYLVKVNYRNDNDSDTVIGAVVLTVAEKIPVAAVGGGSGTVSKNAGVGAVPMDANGSDCTLTVTFQTPAGVRTENVKVTVGMLAENGIGVDTSVTGTHSGLTLTYAGQVITEDFTLYVSQTNEELNDPAYPEEGSVRVDKDGTTTEEDFLKTGVANIQLSATGIPEEKGVDLLVVMDLSGSMEKGVDTNADMSETYEKTRIYAMEQALKNMVDLMQESGADIRIAMSDFGDLDSHVFDGVIIDKSMADEPFFDVNMDNAFDRPNYGANGAVTSTSYEFSNYLNFVMKTDDGETTAYTIANSKFNRANPSFTGKVVPTIYTGSGEANAAAFVDVDELNDAAMEDIIDLLNVNVKKSYGTNYDVGLEYAYQLGYAVQQENIANGEDRKLVCIFLSDGAAMQFNYFSGRAVSSTWADWITGRSDGIESIDQSTIENGAALTALEAELLSLLKAGKLLRADWRRDSGDANTVVVDGTGYYVYYPSKVQKLLDSAAAGIDKNGSEHFYTYMATLGYDLDWEYLQAIMEANGFDVDELPDYESAPDTYWEDMKLPALLELLQTRNETNENDVVSDGHTGYISQLVNPTYDADKYPHYYTKYEGTETDFGKAFEAATGLDLTWGLFADIAYRNRNNSAASGDILALLRAVTDDIRDTDGAGAYQTLSPYAYFYNEDGKNWWAEAMKGDTDKLYPVINKYAYTNSTERPFGYYGDVRNKFSGETTSGLALDGKKYIAGFRGLGMDIYTVSFSVAADNKISSADAETVLRNIATGQNYFYAANSEESLTSTLQAIISTVSHTATRAWFQDTMGDDYDLSTTRTVVNENGEEIVVNAEPSIKVMEYSLTDGVRTGAPNVLETVRFYPDAEGNGTGLKAWSDQVYTSSIGGNDEIVITYSDIWGDDGVIRGKYFYYNTNKTPIKIDMTGDGVLDYTIPGETFLWVIGVIGETEMVLEYQAYLTGSVEGILRSDDVKTYYDTNEEAELTYINYLGNSCTKGVDSPKYPWITYRDGSLVTDKYVEATGDPNEFVLTLEAYAKGHLKDSTKPADIVLVLDHSGSMRTPAGAPQVLESGTRYTGGGEIPRSQINVEKAKHRGYYVAQSTATNSWFVMEYDVDFRLEDGTTAERWVGYLVPSTESIVDTTPGNYTEHKMTLSWVPGSVDANLVFYKSQYAMLYDALLEFIGELKDSGADHRVSLIGFAGSTGEGSRVYVGGDEDMVKTYNAMYHVNTSEARRNELYRKSLKNVQDADGYGELLSAIEAIETNHSFTCPSAGLKMASDLFTANEADLAARDRIVVLFTDGIPNKCIGGDQNTSETQSQIFNEIVSTAYTAKQQGASIYAISTTTLGAGADRTFLSYASSDYPNAKSYADHGDPIASQKFTQRVETIDDFGVMFDSVTESAASVTLDGTAILKEVLTDYFVLDPDDQVDVTVYTAPYDGKGGFGAETELKNATVKLSSSDGVRNDIIEVSGYDYAGEYISSLARDKGGQSYYGSKLIVKVRVRTRDGFWGGNNVPTNEESTGIYDKNRVPVADFPEPEVNVPLDLEITTRDKTIYYGGDVTAEELLERVTAGGMDVTVNDDGTFTPAEDWMNDYADLSWTADSTRPGDPASSTTPDDYTFGVQLTPKYDGTQNRQDEPGNMAGTPVDTQGTSASDTAHVYILVPELTFRDSVTEFGTAAEGYDHNGKNYVSGETEWVNMETDLPADAVVPPVSGTAPELVLTYTPEDNADRFLGDTKVEVTVSVAGKPELDIDSVTNFHWNDCTHTQEHGSCGVINTHKGDADVHEFWVHTTIAIEPDTVVIDFGLSVLIDPLTNDLHGYDVVTEKVLGGIGDSFASSHTGVFGAAAVEGSEVRYTLNTSNGMQMDAEETFKYQGSYTIKGREYTADSTITVIPATIIYYEDSFVQFGSWTKTGSSWKQDAVSAWTVYEGHTEPQATDRPGTEQIGRDMDNLYGYDGAYADESGYSMNSWHEIEVNAARSGEASFTFVGTAFDIIALSGGTTGTILVDVYGGENTDTLLHSFMVDTYYGYKYENGEWTPTDPADPESLYQVPVMKVDMAEHDADGNGYGKYRVVITVSYNKFFDHGQNGQGGSYKFMLDAIRIYDQANDGEGNKAIEDAYVADGEGWPSYTELRNILIGANSFDSLGEDDEVSGIVFIDGIPELTNDSASGESGGIFTDDTSGKSAAIRDYANFGPNNELYLASGQAVAFRLEVPANVQNVHLALKSAGGTAQVRVYDAADEDKINVLTGTADAASIATATDLYYDITGLKNKTVVIHSSGDAILSVTNIKMTHASKPAEPVASRQSFVVSRAVGAMALSSLMPRVETVATGWSGDTEWVLTSDGVLTFSGQGVMKNYTTKTEMPWYAYADQITGVVIGEGITRIGDYAFYGMNIRWIRIASTVTAIGDYAFKNAVKLDGVVLPEGLTQLGESAFYGCTGLTAIDIPAALWTVKPYTFKNCTALARVTFHEGNLMKISDGAFYNTAITELVLPDCLDILDAFSFKNCHDLSGITLGAGITEIREAAFYATAIPAITIPENITKVGPYAFKNCTALETVDLGSVESIGEAAFYGCTALSALAIPDSVTAIDCYAFKNCTGLTRVTFGSGLKTIGDSAFHTCTGLEALVIPGNVASVGEYCFSGCTALTDLVIENTNMAIGKGAFKNVPGYSD